MSVGESQSLGFGPEKAGQNSAWSVSRETYCVVRMLLSEWLWWCSICVRTCTITVFIFIKSNSEYFWEPPIEVGKPYNSIVISVAGGLNSQTLRLNKKMRCKSSRCRHCKCWGSLSLVKASHWGNPEKADRLLLETQARRSTEIWKHCNDFVSLQNLSQRRKTAENFRQAQFI